MSDRSYRLPMDRRLSNNQVLMPTPDRDRSILALGETGSGKTSAIKLMAYQFGVAPSDPLVVFDYKRDYQQFLDRFREEETLRVSLDGSDAVWNVFREVPPDADRGTFNEIARLLFGDEEHRTSNPFFPQAARQVFTALLQIIARESATETRSAHAGESGETDADEAKADDQPETIDNEVLVETLQSPPGDEFDSKAAELYTLLRQHDFGGVASLIDPQASKQTVGVLSHLQMVVGRLFKGDFAASTQPEEVDSFSVREYMQNPDGRALVLDFPIDRGETVKPVYRFFIDWAIRYGLADAEREAYFVLDEFQTIPGLEKIERLVNVGRARNAFGVLGLQSVAQLQGTYGESEARSILSGLSQQVLLRPGDQESTEYVRDQVGTKFVEREVAEPDETLKRDPDGELQERPETQTIRREESRVSEAQLRSLSTGEAVVLTPGKTPVMGRLLQLEEVLTPTQANLEYLDQGTPTHRRVLRRLEGLEPEKLSQREVANIRRLIEQERAGG